VINATSATHQCIRPFPDCVGSKRKARTLNTFPIALQYIKIHENAQTTPSNVPNTAMLTGTARTSVGARPRQKTREPDSAYIVRAVLHVLLPVARARACAGRCACMRVLSTSNGNVTTHPRTPAAPPASSSAAQERCVSSTWPSSGSSRVGIGAKRRRVASYCGAKELRRRGSGVMEGGGNARRKSTSRNRRRRAGSSR
jgi:hypothetical protein